MYYSYHPLPSSFPWEWLLVKLLAPPELGCCNWISALRSGTEVYVLVCVCAHTCMVYTPVWMYAWYLCTYRCWYAPEGMLLRELSFPIYSKVLSNSVTGSGSFETSGWPELRLAGRFTCKHTLSLSSWSVWWCPTCYISFKGPGTATRSPRQQELRAEKSNISILATVRLFCWLVAAIRVHGLCFWKWAWGDLFVS